MRHRNRRIAEELDALLDGRVSPGDVDREARRLAGLATTLVEERPGPVATLPEHRRLAMRDRLLDDIAALESPTTVSAHGAPRTRRATRSARAAVASGLASALIAGTGVTVAAQEALPGDVLYGLKKGTESVRMNLAGDTTQAARLELRFAEERLEEVAVGIPRLRPDPLVDSLAEMDRRALTGAQHLILAAERTEDEQLLAEVAEFVERQSTGLVGVFPRLPIEVRPHAEDSLAILRQVRTDLLEPALEACDCLDVVPAGYHDSTHVRRTTSEPLPPASATEARAEESSEPGPREASERTTTERDEASPIGDLTSRPSTSSDDGVGSELLEPLGDTGKKVGGVVDDTVEKGTDTLDKTTDGVGDVVDETGERLDDTTGKVGDTLGKTTDSVGDLLGSTTDTLGNVLGR